jgi:hypothetical protein
VALSVSSLVTTVSPTFSLVLTDGTGCDSAIASVFVALCREAVGPWSVE